MYSADESRFNSTKLNEDESLRDALSKGTIYFPKDLGEYKLVYILENRSGLETKLIFEFELINTMLPTAEIVDSKDNTSKVVENKEE